ncbi:MAG: hypothetical protein LBN41_03390 [Enterobacteriaceae bacterium]|jgi:hypothetical protein|nr:hypothetical protein [Enterobacteriaceae bacterium]
MKKWILLLAGFFAFAPATYAKVETVEAQGYGETYEKAVDSALADAVRQINGITITTQSESAGEFVRVKDKTLSEEKNTKDNKNNDGAFLGGVDNTATEKSDTNTNRDLSIDTGKSAQINTSSSGVVKGYKVKSRDCDAKGCTVVLIAEVERKAALTSASRMTLAVITTGNRNHSSFANTLRQEITDRIVQSQRFTVLDRSAVNENAFKQEESFLENRQNDAGNVRQSTLPADYLLVINVAEAGVKTSTKVTSVDATGEFDVTDTQKTKVTVRYSLLDAASHGIQWSDSSVFEQSGKSLTSARKQISNVIADKIVNKLTPAKVVAITDGQVVINRGETMVYNGDRFNIYVQGEELLDPDTGEVLDTKEEKIATIAIKSIKDKISYGVVESGNIDAITTGALARLAPAPVEKKRQKAKSKAKTKAVAPKADEQKLGESGGIFLK